MAIPGTFYGEPVIPRTDYWLLVEFLRIKADFEALPVDAPYKRLREEQLSAGNGLL